MFFFYIPSSYAKIWGETKFQPREFPRSGSKAKGVEEKEKERKKTKVGENNGPLCFRLPPRVAQASRLDQKSCT